MFTLIGFCAHVIIDATKKRKLQEEAYRRHQKAAVALRREEAYLRTEVMRHYLLLGSLLARHHVPISVSAWETLSAPYHEAYRKWFVSRNRLWLYGDLEERVPNPAAHLDSLYVSLGQQHHEIPPTFFVEQLTS